MKDHVKDMRRQQNDKLILAITEAAQDAILMMDPEGRVSYWNPAAERIFGYTRDEAIGQDLHALIAPVRFRPAYQLAIGVFRQTAQGAAIGKTIELDACRKDGREFPVQLSLSAVQMDDGWHAVGLIRDITERKHVEEELQRYSAELEKRNKELQGALADIKQLTGMLPICASCKKIRDDKGYWKSVESYIAEHSEAVFSHGICPDCEKKMYGDLDKLITEND